MAGETTLTVIGNLTADPELRFTAQGVAVASFTVASTPRTLDKSTGKWEDGQPLFLRCTAWRQLAENVTESFSRGARVVVVGRLEQRSFETREGEKRTVVEMQADEVAASAKFATVTVHRAERAWASKARPDDPWGQAPPGTAFPDEPPF